MLLIALPEGLDFLIDCLAGQPQRVAHDLYRAVRQLFQNLVLFQDMTGKIPLHLQENPVLAIHPAGFIQNDLGHMVSLGHKLHQLRPFLLHQLFQLDSRRIKHHLVHMVLCLHITAAPVQERPGKLPIAPYQYLPQVGARRNLHMANEAPLQKLTLPRLHLHAGSQLCQYSAIFWYDTILGHLILRLKPLKKPRKHYKATKP